MKWARVEHNGQPVYAIVEGDELVVVDGSPFQSYETLGTRLTATEVLWLPPVVPPTFYCVGLNYTEHIEMEARLRGKMPNFPTQPDVGYRAVNALTGHLDTIEIPADATERVEYEGELVCVVGREAKHLTPENALDCLLGFTIGNDVSERSWQASDRTLWRAKNTDTFKPMGPWIETDVDLDSAQTRVRVNGKQCIEFQTNNMLFGVVDYLVAITRYITLVPGDVLWMGTEGHAEQIKDDDVVDIEITGIGTLSNPVRKL
jgi:2-keto-4-pentenoate hydratase/2-oxohepta-3-ene-1,7-dioic acid hydratase in catechol pathway